MRKRETSPCRAPCHRDRMDPAGGVGVVVGADDVVVGGVEVVAGVVGVGVVASECEGSLGGMSQTWGWVSGKQSRSDIVGLGLAESTGRRRLRGTLQSVLREHGDPGG
jgi:hypothetical protein